MIHASVIEHLAPIVRILEIVSTTRQLDHPDKSTKTCCIRPINTEFEDMLILSTSLHP
jgi:hypothetical protein